MDENITARVNASRRCAITVIGLRVINAQRQVIAALRVAPVDGEGAFRGLAVALLHLVASRGKAERDLVGADGLALPEYSKFTGRFFDQDMVDLFG